MGFFVCVMMGRFYYGILSTNIGNGIFKSFLNIQTVIYMTTRYAKSKDIRLSQFRIYEGDFPD